MALGGLGALVGLFAVSLLLSPRGSDLVGPAVIGGWLLVTGGIGALIAARRPENPVGSLLLGIALIAMAQLAVQQYAIAALTSRRELPAGPFFGWLSTWLSTPAVGLAVLLLLVFPSGRLPSRRWRVAVFAVMAGTTTTAVGLAFTPGPLPAIPSTANPLGIEGARGVLSFSSTLATFIVLIAALAAIASQVIRVRRASRDEAAQIKLVAYAMVMAPLIVVVSQFLLPQDEGDQWLELALNVAAACAIPVAIGVAVLRYRLYDIDVIINRTLVYGSLTATLLMSYLAIIVTLSRVLAPVTRDSDIAVAASTLAVAALFRPLRGRIQAFIDRRFYRSRYDAKLALDAFAARLRSRVEMQDVRDDVIGLVAATLHPAHASVWIRAQEAR